VLKSTNAGTSWTSINSGIADLAMRSVNIDPNTANLLYAGTDASFYYSTNGGSSWTDQANGAELISSGGVAVYNGDAYSISGKGTTLMVAKLPNGSTSWQILSKQPSGSPSLYFKSRDLAIDATNPARLYAAGRADQSTILRSTDGGSTWLIVMQQLHAVDTIGFNAVGIDPNISSKIASVAQRDRFYPNTLNPELTYSTNSGTSWVYPPVPPADADYYALLYKKNSGTPGSETPIIFAAGGTPYSSNPPSILLAGIIEKSTDAGRNWSVLFLPNSDIVFRSMAGDAVNQSRLYGLFVGRTTSTTGGIYTSTNNGVNWGLTNLPSSGTLHHVVSIAQHPSRGGVLYMAEQSDLGVWKISKTTDYGNSWTDISSGIPSTVPINHLVFDQNGLSVYLYAGTEKGVYRILADPSASSNSPFATAYGCTPKTLYSTITSKWHAIYQSDGALFYTYSTDDGLTWFGRNSISGTIGGLKDFSDPVLTEDQSGTLHVVFASDANGIYYTNRPVNGSWISPVQLYAGTQTSYSTLAVDASGTGHVVFVSYETTPPGHPLIPQNAYKLYYGTFSTSSPGVFNPVLITSSSTAITGTTLALYNNQLFAAYSNGGDIYYSSGVGSSWAAPTNISNNAGTSTNPCIINPSGSPIVVWQDNTPGNYDIFSRAKSSGTWGDIINVSNNPSDSRYPFVSLVYSNVVVMWSDSSSSATGYDIYYAYPGASPHKIDSSAQRSLYPGYTTRTIGVTTRVLAVWTNGSAAPYTIASTYIDNPLPKVSTSRERTPSTYELEANYPNPFNPSTLIRYQLPADVNVRLKVFNVLGEEVETLVDGFQSAGQRSAIFNAMSLPSGVYFYRLQAGKFLDVKKMVLTK